MMQHLMLHLVAILGSSEHTSIDSSQHRYTVKGIAERQHPLQEVLLVEYLSTDCTQPYRHFSFTEATDRGLTYLGVTEKLRYTYKRLRSGFASRIST